ncbi:MAG: hypothetical protein C0624_05805 [Desulfuromonas sp.]|nr:MAG: hypothetical protein C0624_05805 [Desulfuromonas sp.]
MQDIIARVNGSPVTRYEYQTVIQEFALGKGGEEQAERPERAELEQLALERLVARELIYQAALADGVVADEENVARECQRTVKGFRSEKAFLEALQKAGGDLNAFQRSMRKDVTVAKMSERILQTVAPPDEHEVDAFYREHPGQLRRPARYALRQLLLPCDEQESSATRQRIEGLKQRLDSCSFVELIRENSECPSALRDGELRDVRSEQMAPQLKELLDRLAPGEVGGPIETPSGFHLVERLDYTPEQVPPLNECRAEIEAYLLRESRSRALAEWVEQLRNQARVECFLE